MITLRPVSSVVIAVGVLQKRGRGVFSGKLVPIV